MQDKKAPVSSEQQIQLKATEKVSQTTRHVDQPRHGTAEQAIRDNQYFSSACEKE
jgi:hypothetical protein